MADRGAELTNKLYYGDNLGILREFPPESVDLVYLDPPFNSNRDYNVIFRDESGRQSDAQQLAFEDTWHWGPSVERHYAFLTNTQLHHGRVPDAVSVLVDALRKSIHENQMLAYLVEMGVRLVELRRVLKDTGSLYLHCDPTASHYLKLMLDAVFGPTQFQNEIIWRRTTPKGNITRRVARNHDVVLHYVMQAGMAKFNPQYLPHDAVRTAEKYSLRDEMGRAYQLTSLLSPNPDRPNLIYEFKGVTRTWRWTRERMEEADRQGLVIVPKGGGSVPRYKRYLDEQEGIPLDDVWIDIPAVNAMARERLGYPTQKPIALLERIIAASSDRGDVVLDPFCGCGTALDAAHRLGRRWLGIDVTYLAIGVVRRRLLDRYPSLTDIEVVNRPTELAGARSMATGSADGRYQFQWWALDEIGATPRTDNRQKGADEGIDGTLTFTDVGGTLQTVIVSVKSGQPRLDDVRVLRAVVERQRAAMGILLTLEEPTGKMRQDAAAAGFWHSDLYDRDYLRVQILSAGDLIDKGKRPDLPPLVAAPYRTPGKASAVADTPSVWEPGVSDLMNEVDATVESVREGKAKKAKRTAS